MAALSRALPAIPVATMAPAVLFGGFRVVDDMMLHDSVMVGLFRHDHRSGSAAGEKDRQASDSGEFLCSSDQHGNVLMHVGLSLGYCIQRVGTGSVDPGYGQICRIADLGRFEALARGMVGLPASYRSGQRNHPWKCSIDRFRDLGHGSASSDSIAAMSFSLASMRSWQ